MSSLTKSVSRLSSHYAPRVLGVTSVQKRDQSTSSLASLKRGTGGRCSFSGIVATVFGATGYLGRPIISRLGRIGSQVIIPYRGDNYLVGRLKVCGDLGQIQFCPVEDIHDEDAIRKSMMHSNVVINLIGREYETWAYDYYDIHTKAPEVLARIAKEMGVERFIHFSDILASPEPMRVIPKHIADWLMDRREIHRVRETGEDYYTGGSHYLKSKYYGELAVRREFPEATIFKPATVWGHRDDKFVRWFLSKDRHIQEEIPVWHFGEETYKQPVYYKDVVDGLMNTIYDGNTAGKDIYCVGPHRYQLRDLLEYVCRVIYDDWIVTDLKLSDAMVFHAKERAKILAEKPFLNFDKFEREVISDIYPEGVMTLEDIGVELTPVEKRIFYELRHSMRQKYFKHFISRRSVEERLPTRLPPLHKQQEMLESEETAQALP